MIMSIPYFSIIIPTLNEERCIDSLLNDLKNQEFKEFEVIHVDGKSEDKTVSIVHTYLSSFPLIQLIAERRNLSFQRNLGASHAKGMYLIFLDADTRLPNHRFLSILFSHCNSSHKDSYFPRTIFPSYNVGIKIAEFVNNTGIAVSHLIGNPLPTSGLAVFNRLFFERIHGYTVQDSQDKKNLFVEDQEILQRGKGYGMTTGLTFNITYTFSLRRFEKDGWFAVLRKILTSSWGLRSGKDVSSIEYEMGGQYYRR